MQNVTGVLPGGAGKLLLALVHCFLGVSGQICHRHERKEPFLAGTPRILPGELAVLSCFESFKPSFCCYLCVLIQCSFSTVQSQGEGEINCKSNSQVIVSGYKRDSKPPAYLQSVHLWVFWFVALGDDGSAFR